MNWAASSINRIPQLLYHGTRTISTSKISPTYVLSKALGIHPLRHLRTPPEWAPSGGRRPQWPARWWSTGYTRSEGSARSPRSASQRRAGGQDRLGERRRSSEERRKARGGEGGDTWDILLYFPSFLFPSWWKNHFRESRCLDTLQEGS